ncbi:hypothetical protein E2320_015098 [Naja naja]|nr:hypothetical protein E2320_015098 [Naja naja]
MLAALFIYINSAAHFLAKWNEAIVILFHKNKGVCLILPVTDLLLDWIQSKKKILAEEQVGFRGEGSTLDYSLWSYTI